MHLLIHTSSLADWMGGMLWPVSVILIMHKGLEYYVYFLISVGHAQNVRLAVTKIMLPYAALCLFCFSVHPHLCIIYTTLMLTAWQLCY